MTSEPFSLERFQALADAYGGVIARWPISQKDDALRVSRTLEGRAILADARALDDTLDSWLVPAPNHALAARVLAGAPRTSIARSVKLWWTAIGMTAALSGATAGIAATTILTPTSQADSMTVFGDLPAGSDSNG
ncbi:hypothetical protein SFC76_19050 [Sphingomonas sp. CD22]|uniref:hypothetical protein n=1 Tax=Sphingomonas sp. CD22 TaxID=3100214 RepID=UPI002ADF069D|nr:hypothetical protein [Sphingomonas sp. CD22]MEA1086375.1 hypothetical protein [Sphingomonas sp. CD22]